MPLIFPAWESLPREQLATDPVFTGRMRVLRELEPSDALPPTPTLPPQRGGGGKNSPQQPPAAGTIPKRVIVTALPALLQPVPTREDLSQATRTLRVGDYIVHMLHGVGRYEGLTQLSLSGVPGDFVVVQYQGTDKLYLPVHRLGEIERYTSAEAKAPKLDRLGGQSFATKTGRVKAEVAQLAHPLLEVPEELGVEARKIKAPGLPRVRPARRRHELPQH